MDRGFQFLEYVFAHFVARRAEFLGIGHFKGRVERTPEDDACDKPPEHQHAQGKYGTRPPQRIPQIPRKRENATPRRGGAFGRCHRRPPGCVRDRSVSTSTKSFSTGAFTSCWGT